LFQPLAHMTLMRVGAGSEFRCGRWTTPRCKVPPN
jgi:hypothetical protein